MIRLFTFLLLAILSFPGWGALLLNSDFETALTKTPLYVKSVQPNAWVINPNVWSNGWCYTQATHGYESYSLSTTYKRTGSKSIRNHNNTLNKSDACVTAGVSASLLKSRQEMVLGMGIPDLTTDIGSSFRGNTLIGDEIWYGASYYYPSNEGTNSQWWSASSPRMNIVQFMAHGNSFTPELFVMLGNSGRVDFQIRTSSPSSPTELVINDYHGQFQMDRWNDLVIRWKRGYDNTGIFQAWINGVLVANRVNQPVSIHDKPYMYIAAGQYFGVDRVDRAYVQYIDSVKIGDENSSFSEVSPGSIVITCPGDPACPPVADAVITSVNSGAAVTHNQSRVPFTAEVPAGHSIYGCTINNVDDRAVFWDYVGKASGFFNANDINQFSSLTAKLRCFSESYEQRLVGSASTWGNSLATESAMTGDKFGFTSGQVITRTGADNYSYGSIAGSADILGNAGDKMRFDFTYYCDMSDTDGAGPVAAGDNCKNLYFAVVDYDVDKRLTMEGDAGSLVAGNYGGGFGENVEVKNEYYGEGVYKARIKVNVTKTTPQRYKYYGGTKGSATPVGHQVANLEVVVRKNYTTKVASKDIPIELTDVTAPTVACTNPIPVVLDPQSGTYTANIACTTTELGGDAFAVIKTTNSPPADADAVIAATGAAWSASAPVDSTTITFEAGGFSYQDLWAYVVHRDAAGNKSAVASVAFSDGVTYVKRIKFLDSGTRLRTRNGAVFGGSLDYFTLHPTDPRLPGPKTDLVLIDNPTITAGIPNFTEADTQCGTCSGSINALPLGQYWYSARSTDGTIKAVNTINIVDAAE